MEQNMVRSIDIVRMAKMTTLPPDGGWVIVRGNPNSPRGLRIPEAIRREGVRHFDVYYAYDEDCPWNFHLNYRNIPRSENGAKDAVEELCDRLRVLPHLQATWVTLHTPSSKQIRLWCGEVSSISSNLLKDLIAEGGMKIMPFSKLHRNLVWDEATRDLIGSLMVDGLSLNEAQDMLIRAGEKFDRREVPLPDYFYRATGTIYDTFCEEPEYNQIWKKERRSPL